MRSAILRLLDGATFEKLAVRLTGTPVTIADAERTALSQVLSDDERSVDQSQFNELLLLVNKNRMGRPMFRHFFGESCRVGDLEIAVEHYLKVAMLRYGNFIFAYRTLSRIEDDKEFLSELGTVCMRGDQTATGYQTRPDKLLEIEKVPRNDTPLAGYLSTRQIISERARIKLLQSAAVSAGTDSSWARYEEQIRELAQTEGVPALLATVSSFRRRAPRSMPSDFAALLSHFAEQIESRHSRLLEVQRIAARNQDVYLTWDHMDVYFATSMRKAWEFADLYDFIDELTNEATIRELRLRYFDPTQSYTANHIDKGLVEALMLKRAKCTVYSVQDTDTLGKDSELAATLAQGKPVIAFVPDISVDERSAELLLEHPETIFERLRFVLNADDLFLSEVSRHSQDFLALFRCSSPALAATLP
jgi:predicted TIM-barrel fold metal-dependent hydrolase